MLGNNNNINNNFNNINNNLNFNNPNNNKISELSKLNEELKNRIIQLEKELNN